MNDELITEAGVASLDDTSSGEGLQAQLDAANAKADENWNKFLLAMADFENYKKQMEKRVHMIVSDRRKSVLLRILPVIDNLERALKYNTSGDQKLRDGLEATLRGFESVLGSEGVKPIDVTGAPFDPRTMEAIGTSPAADGVADETVVEVAERGYMMDDELLRPAKVLVAKHA